MPTNDPNLITLRPVATQSNVQLEVTPAGIAQFVFGLAWRMIPVYFLWQIAKNTDKKAKL